MNDQLGTIEIEREPAPWRDRARAYKVLLDGNVIGSVRDASTFRCDAAPGNHRISLKIDFKGSRELNIEVAPGGRRTLVCRPNGSSGTTLFDLFSKKRPWIDLELTA